LLLLSVITKVIRIIYSNIFVTVALWIVKSKK
jgi:hypothetical protein